MTSTLELLKNSLLRCPDMQPCVSRSRYDELSCLLLTLFKLLGVVPTKHGVFRTISALVQHDRKACLEAWVFLEESQVLPTWMLSQHPIVAHHNSPLLLKKKWDAILHELDQPDGSCLCNEEFLGSLCTFITRMKESMKIKDAITSGIEINDSLTSSIACELCNNDSDNENTMSNLKHVKSFI